MCGHGEPSVGTGSPKPLARGRRLDYIGRQLATGEREERTATNVSDAKPNHGKGIITIPNAAGGVAPPPPRAPARPHPRYAPSVYNAHQTYNQARYGLDDPDTQNGGQGRGWGPGPAHGYPPLAPLGRGLRSSSGVCAGKPARVGLLWPTRLRWAEWFRRSGSPVPTGTPPLAIIVPSTYPPPHPTPPKPTPHSLEPTPSVRRWGTGGLTAPSAGLKFLPDLLDTLRCFVGFFCIFF